MYDSLDIYIENEVSAFVIHRKNRNVEDKPMRNTI
jgi:hypothetical protein